MLRLHQIRLSLQEAAQGAQDCRRLAARRLQIPEAEILSAHITRRSVDARDRRDVHFTLSLTLRLPLPKRNKR